MHVRSTATGLELLAPAKLNLFLEVLGKRDDGFHEIETLMVPIALYDTLHFEPTAKGAVELSCWQLPAGAGRQVSGAGMPAVRAETLPLDSSNLVVRAVELLRRRLGVAAGARLGLIKRIPLAAGLAGGSSDAAAALVAANRGWKLGLSNAALHEAAAELGSDVPFFLGRGAALCTGRGEKITPIAGLACSWYVVVKPPAGLATAAVYRACRPGERPRRAGALVDALRRGHWAAAGQRLHNRLQAAAENLSPWIARLKEEFSVLGCHGHQMSGSGTSYFGLCRHAWHARRVAARLRTRDVGQVYAVASTC